MATVKRGARIEMLSVGSLSESYAVGQYWAKKLAHGATVSGINMKSVSKGWKIIIKYEPKEADQ